MEIRRLRARLAEIDRDLLDCAARRQKLVAEIGRAKRAAGLPARDWVQEREVIQRAREAAAAQGLPDGLAERLLLPLIESSLAAQEQDRVASGARGSGKRALVIGGSGKMGRWFLRFLASQGYRVEVADPVAPAPGVGHVADWRDSDLGHEVIVVAAPLRETNRILTDLAAAGPPGLVFDIGSLKTPLRSGLGALVRSGARVASIHPMFGPATELLSGRHVIFVDLGVADAAREAHGLFESTMALRVDMDLERHDQLIAYVLGLSHALNIAFFTSLADSGETAGLLERLSSTTFDSQLRVALAVARENPHLYFEIQALNDYGSAALASLAQAIERVRAVIASGDERAFVALMERGRDYLATLGPR